MSELARHTVRTPGSGVREILHRAYELKDAIHLVVGEPDFPTPPHVVEAAHRAALSGFTKYGPSAGEGHLRDLLVERVERVCRYRPERDNVTISVGGVQGILATLIALLDPGDEVLIPDPAWPNYEMATLMLNAVPVRYPLMIENGFVPRPSDLETLITAKTKVIILNSPNNPTGAVYPRSVIEKIAEIAARRSLYLLSDEVYDELVFEGEHVSPMVYAPERTIGIYSFSKVYSMTGWRVGYVVANRVISAAIQKLQEPQVSCVATVNQKAAEAALSGSQEIVTQMREAYRTRRDAVVTLVAERGFRSYVPHGAFYIMVDIARARLPSREFALRLLQERRVAVAPGGAFGPSSDGLVRISLSTELSSLLEGVTRTLLFVDLLAR